MSVGVPLPTANPYPTINEVMDIARARVGDMINDATGDLLANTVPASQVYLNAAWKWLQRQCATAGVETFKKEITIYAIPPRPTDDTANQSYLTWLGCSDGVNQYEAPRLPQDLILPLSLWRRQNGTQAVFVPMLQATDGLPRFLDCQIYDWRADGLYFYGDIYAQDFQVRYSAYRDPLSLTMPGNAVPIMMCEDCLGARVAYEFASTRGSEQAPQLKAWADEAFQTIKMGSTQRKQRQNIRRQPYNRRGYCPGYPVVR